MQHYTDEELLDGFRKENLSDKKKEAFLERAANDKGFVGKFIENLEQEDERKNCG